MGPDYSFKDFFNTLVFWIGSAGVIAVIFFLVVIIAVMLMWRYGLLTLLWTYMILVLITAGQTVSVGSSVLPPEMTSICSSVRWFVFIPLSFVGFIYLFTGKVKRDSTLWLLLAWAVLALISAAAGLQDIAFERAFAMFLIGIGFVAHRIISVSNGLDDYLRTYLVLSVICVCMVIIIVLVRPGMVFLGGRFRGFVNNPNMMGWISAAMLIPSAWAWLDNSEVKPFRKTAGYILTIFWFVCLFLTASISSIIASIPIFLSIIILKKANLTFWASAVIFGMVGFCTLAFFMQAEGISHLQEMDPTNRIMHTEYGLSVASERPFIGHGYGYSTLYVRVPWSGKPIHNSYAAFAIDLGFVGIFLFAAISFLAIRNTKAICKFNKLMYIHPTAPMLLGAFLVMNLINAAAEGWLTGIGSPQLFTYIILLSVLNAERSNACAQIYKLQQSYVEDVEYRNINDGVSLVQEQPESECIY